jgi:hypothetical protein
MVVVEVIGWIAIGWIVIGWIGLMAVVWLAVLYVCLLRAMEIPRLIRDAFRWLYGHRGRSA